MDFFKNFVYWLVETMCPSKGTALTPNVLCREVDADQRENKEQSVPVIMSYWLYQDNDRGHIHTHAKAKDVPVPDHLEDLVVLLNDFLFRHTAPADNRLLIRWRELHSISG
jgi:hypothetical protein